MDGGGGVTGTAAPGLLAMSAQLAWVTLTTTPTTVNAALPATGVGAPAPSPSPSEVNRIGAPSVLGCAIEDALHCRGWTTGSCVYPGTLTPGASLQRRNCTDKARPCGDGAAAVRPRSVAVCGICDRHSVTSAACAAAAAAAAVPGAVPASVDACPAVAAENADARRGGCAAPAAALGRRVTPRVVWPVAADALVAMSEDVAAALAWWWVLVGATGALWALAFLA